MACRFALQTFTVRKYIKAPSAIAEAFSRIRRLGIGAVELAYIRFAAEEIAAVKQACASQGITVGSTQITFNLLNSNRAEMLRWHQELGCRLTSVSVLPDRVIRGKRDNLLRFAEELNALGGFYRQRGLQLCFHHHDYEFRRYGDEVGLDLLLANTEPENVGLELDTYWVQRGGRSPQDMINDLGSRVKLVHLRDFCLRRRFLHLSPSDCELGQGNLDLCRIVNSCCDHSVQFMAIEQDTATPFDSVATSVSYLKSLGYEALF